ncbi:hypothetical protein M9H77_16663 [Catharanthus roseus]|uniref:Uncharacterized protein n=1 Tax=Catharanthus roseus TaxID=4058 RepID=A0ACC0B2E0_CATRO|nr:hypothetical protein M9H77_16663 [Catharanthus roseus]
MIGSMNRVRNFKRGHRNKFRHPVVNTSLNSKAQCTNVTSLDIPTKPSCATLAIGPLMIRCKTQYRLGPKSLTVLRPLSTGSRSRVTLSSMSFGRGALVRGTSHAQCKSFQHVDQKCISCPFLPD